VANIRFDAFQSVLSLHLLDLLIIALLSTPHFFSANCTLTCPVVIVKVRVFYSVRFFLGLISTITETVLVVALSRRYGKRLACYVLAMLCLTSGCFFASTSMFLIFQFCITMSMRKALLQICNQTNLLIFVFLSQVSCQVHFLCML
jgi:hypothetical protein